MDTVAELDSINGSLVETKSSYSTMAGVSNIIEANYETTKCVMFCSVMQNTQAAPRRWD